MEENQSPILGSKQDMVDRKAAWIERMFDRLFSAIQKDVKGAIIVVLIGAVMWQQNVINKKDERWITDVTKLNDKINDAIEKRVDVKVNEKIAPIQAKQDSTSKAVDTSLLNLNGTVETVKQYLIKNKKR